MPKVSVIIPTYNRSALLKEAIASVLAQTMPDLEIIVVDDGSTDDTRAVVEVLPDNRIRYFYKPNGGVSSARNYGISKTNGDYIAFLDSDDLWPKDYLQIMIKYLQAESQYGAVYCAAVSQLPNGRIIKADEPVQCKSGRITSHLFQHGVIWPSAAVIRRKITRGIFFDELLNDAEDSDFFLRLSVQAKFLFIPDVRIVRRVSPDSLSSGCELSCNRILSLERFYFQLGGDRFIAARAARRKLSHAYRSRAQEHLKEGARIAALFLYKRAIKYCPFDVRLYSGLVRSTFLSRKRDTMPSWQMPRPLGFPQNSADARIAEKTNA
jgi:glycosyltransferase involved in cell wall biosynthesis